MSKQPISPVTDPLQFRAIGLVRGIYSPESPNCFTSGVIRAMDDTRLEAVLLGRMIHLMRRYVDLEQPHTWVCYPRNRNRDHRRLHLQVMGIWEPSLLDRSDETPGGEAPQEGAQAMEELAPELSDGYFSVRGELVFTNPETERLLVRIRQQPRVNTTKRARNFKLMLHGVIPHRALRHFLSLDLKRHGQILHVEHYDVIQPMTCWRLGRRQGGRGPMPNSRRPMGRPSGPGGPTRPSRPRPRQGVLKRLKPDP